MGSGGTRSPVFEGNQVISPAKYGSVEVQVPERRKLVVQMDSCVAFCSCKSGCSAYDYWMVTISLYGICAHSFNPVKSKHACHALHHTYRFRNDLQDQTQTAALVLPQLPLTALLLCPQAATRSCKVYDHKHSALLLDTGPTKRCSCQHHMAVHTGCCCASYNCSAALALPHLKS